jgi:hypothetical protein
MSIVTLNLYNGAHPHPLTPGAAHVIELREALLQLSDPLRQTVCEVALAGDGGSLTAVLGPMVTVHPSTGTR